MIKMVIFDLDDTIVDSKVFEEKRKDKKWEELDSYLDDFSILCDAKSAIDYLQDNGITISIVTTSPKDLYALRVLSFFDIEIQSDNVYGFEALMANREENSLPLKAFTICKIKKDNGLLNNEILFVGDTHTDFLACTASNIPFVSLKNSDAYDFFQNKLLYVENSYFELKSIIDEINQGQYTIHKRDNEYIGEFSTFSNYIKDIFNNGSKYDISWKITYDSMHDRILELKNNTMKSAVNWLYLIRNLPISEHYKNIDFVVRALGSDECTFDSKKIRTLDLIGFFIASKLEIQYHPMLLTKKQPNEKLHLSGKSREERKAIIQGNYDCNLDKEDKTILVIDDVITTAVTLEEIERAIKEKKSTTNVIFSTISQTVNYEDEFYIQNIRNSEFFYCANNIFDADKYQTFTSVLGKYLFDFLPVENNRSVYRSKDKKYLFYMMDIEGITILNKKPNKYIYVSYTLDNEIVVYEKTRIDFFDDLSSSRLYNNVRTPASIKIKMEEMYQEIQ